MKIYAGIGSRETPKYWQDIFTRLGKTLAEKGWTLRSGGAIGADQAFEKGCDMVKGKKEIYLPWKGFEGSSSNLYDVSSDEHFEMAKKFHPAWNRCSEGAKKMHARNCSQIFGKDLKHPVSQVLCWTVGGSGQGGTGQALRIAKENGIPIFDFGKYKDYKESSSHLVKFIEKHGLKEKETVFVFGSNTEGRHGKGAALTAKTVYGAVYGQARGRQGNAYGIVTKDLSKGERSISLEDIFYEIQKFISYARQNPSTIFKVSPIGCGLAGYKDHEIAPMFRGSPENVVFLRKEWVEYLVKQETPTIPPKVVHCKGNSENTEK